MTDFLTQGVMQDRLCDGQNFTGESDGYLATSSGSKWNALLPISGPSVAYGGALASQRSGQRAAVFSFFFFAR